LRILERTQVRLVQDLMVLKQVCVNTYSSPKMKALSSFF
jgi:hypothetical protein